VLPPPAPPPAALPEILPPEPAEVVTTSAIEDLDIALDRAALTLGHAAVIAHLKQWIKEHQQHDPR
jgi:hypothetical protein